MPSIQIKPDKPWKNSTYKSKYNKELDAKKQSVIVNIEQQSQIETVRTKGGDIVFDQGIAVLPNDTRADEVVSELRQTQKHPDQYALIKNREGFKRESGHNYHFGQLPEMPWKNGGSNES